MSAKRHSSAGAPKALPDGAMSSRKFAQIKASIQEVGLIEPLSVAKPDIYKDDYLLLDGHMRVLALRELGESEAACLIATDDETYTYVAPELMCY